MSYTRPLVYVLDLVKAVFIALESDENGEAFNITESDMSLRDYYNCCMSYKESTTSNRDVARNKPNEFSTEKAKIRLNWCSEFSHEDNIHEAIEIKKKLL